MAITYQKLETYIHNDIHYKRGDAIVVTGKGWNGTNLADSSWTADYENKKVYFYGFCQWKEDDGAWQDGAHPLMVCSNASDPDGSVLCYMNMSAIQSGGTKAYYLDLNFIVNGTTVDDSSIAKADVYINGTKTWSGIGDYYVQHPSGTTYEIKNIVVASGYRIYQQPTLSGTLTEKTTLNVFIGKDYTYSFNANGGTGAPSSMTKTYGMHFTFPTAKPTRTGYTFVGWTQGASGTTVYSAGTQYSGLPDANTTFYAKWEEHYLTVNFYSNYATSYNGTNATLNTVNNNNVLIYSYNYYYDNTYSTGLLNYSSGSTLGMVKTGYTATGKWGTSESGGTLIDQGESFDSGELLAQKFGKTLANNNVSINVYAQWSPNKYIITYKANGGVESDVKQTVYYDTLWTTKDVIFTRIGYKQISWNTKADGTGATYSLNTQQTNKQLSNVTLYAVWEVVNIVSYKINNKWNLCHSNFKVDNSWHPAIMYQKINGTWKQSVLK